MTDAPDLAPDPLLLVILGPTASGKSSLAIRLAQRFTSEIVSCDSIAVYRNFEIGTAKPSQSERALVPHHLIDVADPGETFTAGEYARQARAAIAEISSRGKLPIVVGGTGLYLRALLEGLFPGPQRSEELRDRLREIAGRRGSPYLHRLLSRLDSSSASQIHPNDAPKLIRAIEVCLAARQPMSELWQERGRDPLTGYRILRLGLNPDREQLYERINARAAAMFEQGLVEETARLLQQYPQLSAAAPFNSLGYKQAVAYLCAELTLAQAVALTQQGHRNYAKRQMTWFRREPNVSWLDGFGDDDAIAARAVEMVRAATGG
ncbi:MAG: tRNA (adenosine(37)-N6)-dimethylallyltransferase MiaA [Candidatus Korobacteraceae bacterium]